jgi:hypothetical protein
MTEGNTSRDKLPALRKIMAQLGYSIMHRRNGKYWIVSGTPMTLTEIEKWIERQMASD